MSKNKKRESFFAPSHQAVNYGNTAKKESVQDDAERIKITNDAPDTFTGAYVTDFMETKEIGAKINKIFNDVFEDYHGCIVTADPNNASRHLKIDMFFIPQRESHSKQDSRAFVPVGSTIDTTGDNRIMSMVKKNMMSSNKRNDAFELTSYASEVLFDFVPDNLTRHNIGGKKIDWKNPDTYRNYITETPEIVNGQNVIFCSIDCIDIVKVLAFIYGEKDPENKSDVYYNVVLDRPATQMGFNGVLGANWIVTVTKMTKKQFESTMPKLGQNAVMGRLPINTTISN